MKNIDHFYPILYILMNIHGSSKVYLHPPLLWQVDVICEKLYFKTGPNQETVLPNQWLCIQTCYVKFLVHPDKVASLFNHAFSLNCMC